MNTSNHPAPAYKQAIACFASLVALGVSIETARAIASLYAPVYVRPVYVSISQRSGVAVGLLAVLGYAPAPKPACHRFPSTPLADSWHGIARPYLNN